MTENVNVGAIGLTVKLTLAVLVTPPSVKLALIVVVPAFIPFIVFAIFDICYFIYLILFMSY